MDKIHSYINWSCIIKLLSSLVDFRTTVGFVIQQQVLRLLSQVFVFQPEFRAGSKLHVRYHFASTFLPICKLASHKNVKLS